MLRTVVLCLCDANVHYFFFVSNNQWVAQWITLMIVFIVIELGRTVTTRISRIHNCWFLLLICPFIRWHIQQVYLDFLNVIEVYWKLVTLLFICGVFKPLWSSVENVFRLLINHTPRTDWLIIQKLSQTRALPTEPSANMMYIE